MVFLLERSDKKQKSSIDAFEGTFDLIGYVLRRVLRYFLGYVGGRGEKML